MALLGQGAVAIWNDVAPEGLAEFYEWHHREHMPERVGIPGFRRGRRYTKNPAAACDDYVALPLRASVQNLHTGSFLSSG